MQTSLSLVPRPVQMGPGNEAKPVPNSKYALLGNTLVSEISLVPGVEEGEKECLVHTVCACA